MTFISEKGFLAACLSGLMAAAVVAGAALPANAQSREERCRNYARDAVDAADQNDRNRCGYTGPRWNADRGPHFAWCMLVGPRNTEGEAQARSDDIRRCLADRRPGPGGGNREGKRANCDTYSSIAAVQADANDKYKCGGRGGTWNSDKRAHFQWCMTNKREFMLDETRYRSEELQKCFNNLGDYDDEHWDRGYHRRYN